MSERKSSGNMVRVGRGLFALATLAAMVLALAGLSRAQAPSAASKSVRAGKSAPKGHQEGIQVHGHWTIEVRNPDGKLVKHLEFENSLESPFGGPLLMALLSGQNSPGAWAIGLEPPGGFATNGNNFVCKNPMGQTLTLLNLGTYDAYFCFVAQSGASYPYGCTDNSGCFQGLTVTAPTAVGQGVTLAGQMTAETSGTIGGVMTTLCTCSSSVTPTACPTATINNGNLPVPPLIVQEAGGSAGQLAFPFGIPLTLANLGAAGSCGGMGQPPCQLQVQEGQVVSVAVVLTFM